jgi:hypothetical protein
MRITLLHRLFFAFGFVATLAACGGGITPGASAISPSQNAQPAKKSDLLYVSDSSKFDVFVYTYPQGTLSQTLTGFGDPNGLCVDKKGDVFVTDQVNEDVVEYAHGGSTPIATLSDAEHKPADCAVNPKNGDLAVTNIQNDTTTGAHGPASVAIFKPNSSKLSKLYMDKAFASFRYCGYDPKGNLYINGYNKNGVKVLLAELPYGSSTFTTLKVSQTLFGPGGIQWNGKYLAMSDQQSEIYQFSISGSDATEHSSTSLEGSSSVYQFQIQGRDVAATSAGSASLVGIWKYPAGGSAIKTITGFYEPLGLAISAGK